VVGEKRLRLVKVMPEILLTIIKDTDFIVLKDGQQIRFQHELPDDAEHHHAFYLPDEGTFVIAVESASYSPAILGGYLRTESITISVYEPSRHN
jgi:hypothetical protein